MAINPITGSVYNWRLVSQADQMKRPVHHYNES